MKVSNKVFVLVTVVLYMDKQQKSCVLGQIMQVCFCFCYCAGKEQGCDKIIPFLRCFGFILVDG